MYDPNKGLEKGKDRYGNSKEDLDCEHDIQADIKAHNSDPGVGERIENPGSVDEGKWKEAKEASKKSVGEVKWPLVSYIYKKMGGTFHRKD